MADEDQRLDDTLGALIPRGGTVSGRLLDVLTLLGDVPVLGNIVKPMVIAGGWWLEDRKPDRVFPVLLALKEKLHDAEKKQNEYVRKDEFKDLFEETLRRIADEPDPQRREWLQNILLKVIDQPKDHAENRLFLRLVEELSIKGHKVLGILKMPTAAPSDQMKGTKPLLAERAGVPEEEMKEILDELVRTGLIAEDRLNEAPKGMNGFHFLLTRLGREFFIYRGGTS